MRPGIRYIAGIISPIVFAAIWWNKNYNHFWQATSLLMVVAGTYVITKTTFVDFMIREYRKNWESRQSPSCVLKLACYLYCIKLDDLRACSDAVAPDFEKFRNAISFQDPFRGFVWITVASAIQLFLTFRS